MSAKLTFKQSLTGLVFTFVLSGCFPTGGGDSGSTAPSDNIVIPNIPTTPVPVVPSPSPSPSVSPSPSPSSCVTYTGTSWIPSVAGVSSSNHKADVTILKDTFLKTGPLTGISQPATSDRELTVTFTIGDLGVSGSFSLIANVVQFPSNLVGHAYPMLVSLNDGVNELVNLKRNGTNSDCVQSGFYSCTNGSCTRNNSCSIQSPSAFADRGKWEQYQIPPIGYVSTNTFPTCKWSSGSPSCAFNSVPFFSNGKLRAGTYTAKYIMLMSNYASNNTGYQASMEVNVIKKTNQNASGTGLQNGAIDLNVVLVGQDNVQASRTAKGKANLNALFTHVYNHYAQSNVGVKIGSINAYEWDCRSGGEAFANQDIDELEDLFEQGSGLMPTQTEGKALNIFLLTSIPYSSGSNLTILGASAAIAGPMINGTGSSGLAFSSFGELSTFNPRCGSSASCPISLQEEDFVDMGSTISHEIGHYLGLNHLTESSGSSHDAIPDTPQCISENISGTNYVTQNSCLSSSSCSTPCTAEANGSYNGITRFCPNTSACQFNHVMWWTTKSFSETTGVGDGNIFSADSSNILLSNPFIN